MKSPTVEESRYLNRALTWLEFNGRVLDEASEPESPVLERARFLGIFAANMDEFFMVRVAGIRELTEAGVDHRGPDGLAPDALLESIHSRARALFARAASVFENEITTDLRASGVRFVGVEDLDPRERQFVAQHFARELLPVLTPVAMDPELPTPRIANLTLHVAALVARAEGDPRLAIVQIPRLGSRWIQVGRGGNGHADAEVSLGARYVLVEEVVRAHLGDLMQGQRIVESVAFRVTRDADFATDDQEAEDLIEAVRQVLKHRMSGDPMRLEVEVGASDALVERLRTLFGLAPEEVYRMPRPLDHKFLMDFARLPSVPAPRAKAWPPQPVPVIPGGEHIWEALRERDYLLFHPYESFEPILRLLRVASDDPAVLAIKQTLYRTSSNSEVVQSLERAAQNGKQVTVLVELQARFDEERNVGWARRLEDAGAQVLYGLAGLKTHAKALLIVRRGPGGIERYAQIGTGNYNERTALEYSDLSLLTAEEDLCADLTGFFNVVTGYSEPLEWRRIAMAPLGLRARFVSLIHREAERARAGDSGRIRAKMNALLDRKLIDALYEASQAGVEIDLNVRGSCALRPGVKGLSGTIRVVSLVDRFLEHSRIFEFQNGGDVEVYFGSADWMPRNLDRRVELVVPVREPAHRARLAQILDTIFSDQAKASDLTADGTLVRRRGKRVAVRAQEKFWEDARARAAEPPDPHARTFQPLTRAPQ